MLVSLACSGLVVYMVSESVCLYILIVLVYIYECDRIDALCKYIYDRYVNLYIGYIVMYTLLHYHIPETNKNRNYWHEYKL